MRQANLTISRRSSTQAALSQADIVLLEDSPQVLSVVLDKGQRIVNGLLDVLKLNLTQVFSLALLILGIRLFSFGFPYASAQGTAIAVVTVAIPSVGLSLWAAAGVLPSASLSRLLSRFVMPAAILMSAAGLVVYVFFLDRTGELAYAQLTLTYTLVGCGLLLVIFVRPPGRAWLSGSGQRGDWRFVVLALALMVAFFLVSAVPLAQEFLKLDWLRQPSDYLVVGLAMLAWALGLRFVLRVIPVERRVHGSGSQD
jgi:magnesium-transporting ATPase (P-type)